MEQPLSEHLEQHLEFQGVVAFPGDELYKSAIARAWNWRVRESAHPRAIFFATGTRDVVQLVRYATANKLRLSVLNGGMNPSGRSLDGDVVLVLPRSVATPFFPSSAQLTRPMPADVLSIQSRRSHTLPRVRCGRTSIGVCTCVQVLFALLKFGLELSLWGLCVPAPIVQSIGVAGSSLGGGWGYVSKVLAFAGGTRSNSRWCCAGTRHDVRFHLGGRGGVGIW